MMKGVIPELHPEIIATDKLCEFRTSLFGVDELPEDQIKALAEDLVHKTARNLQEHVCPAFARLPATCAGAARGCTICAETSTTHDTV